MWTKKVSFPDQDGNTVGVVSSSSCVANYPMEEFVFDIKNETGTTFGNTGIKNPGSYWVFVEFEQSGNFEPTQNGHEFQVVENICDTYDLKDRMQCFTKSYDSCQSAYTTYNFTENNIEISAKAIVASWNDCTLMVYTNSLGGNSSFDRIRSICNGITLGEDSLKFEDCNNANYLPLAISLWFGIVNLQKGGLLFLSIMWLPVLCNRIRREDKRRYTV